MKFVKRIVLILLAVGVVTIGVIAVIAMTKTTCTGIEVVIHDENGRGAVSVGEIEALVAQSGIAIIGEKKEQIALKAIHQLLAPHPFIKSIDAINFSGSTLLIELTTKRLLLHVFPNHGAQFFVDDTGEFLPYRTSVAEALPIVNGAVSDRFEAGKQMSDATPALQHVYNIAQFIRDDDFYSAQFKQFYVNAAHDIEVVPAVGRQLIVLGDSENLAEKLDHLKATYRNGIVYMDARYSCLDLRFKNRIIAKKI